MKTNSMKKYIIGLALFSTSSTFAFTDVSFKDLYYPSTTYLEQIGVFKGYEDGSFGKDKFINRAESLKTILVAASFKFEENKPENLFSDVPNDVWFSKYVYAARNKQIVSGDGSTGTFAPARTVNKAEFMKMALKAFEVDTSKFPLEDVHLNDIAQDAWFADFMKFGVKYKILNTDSNGNVLPGKELTRAECADIIFSLLQQGHGLKPQKLLDITLAHLLKAEEFIKVDRIADATIHVSIAERFSLLADKQIPNNKIVQSAIKSVESLKSLLGAFLLGQKGKLTESEASSKKAWALADESFKLNEQNKDLSENLKEIAAKMAAKARGE